MHRPTADEMIRALDLKPHPEGGHYRETFRDPRQVDGRPASTAILFLLARGERSHWHRIDAVEIWHYYAGAPLKLELVDGSKEEIFRLGADIHAGEVPQVTVPARAWQAAESLGPWTLAGCTVAPGFSLDGFELAHKDWSHAANRHGRACHRKSGLPDLRLKDICATRVDPSCACHLRPVSWRKDVDARHKVGHEE